MTEHERLAKEIIVDKYNEYVGGLECTLYDNKEDTSEYQNAYRELHSKENLIDSIYYYVIDEIQHYYRYAKHIKFAGKTFIKDEIKKLLIRDHLL